MFRSRYREVRIKGSPELRPADSVQGRSWWMRLASSALEFCSGRVLCWNIIWTAPKLMRPRTANSESKKRWNLEANDLEMAAVSVFVVLLPQLCVSFNFCPFYCHLCLLLERALESALCRDMHTDNVRQTCGHWTLVRKKHATKGDIPV